MWRNLFGRAIGAAGGVISKTGGGLVGEPLRQFGGQLTGGQRTFNLVPTATGRGAVGSSSSDVKGIQAQESGFGDLLGQLPAGGGAQATGGSASTGQGPRPQVATTNQAQSVEAGPGEPSLDFSAINEALGNLESLEQETRTLLGGGEQQAEAYRGTAEAQAREAKGKGQAAVAQQEARTQRAGEEAEAQQRRGFSEIAQQFLGRFGRGGFGAGLTASLGEATLQNVGRIRAGVQDTMQRLFEQKQQIETEFDTAIQEAAFQAETLKNNAKSQLQNALGEINSRRVALQSQKANLVNQALENYRQQVIDINARNTAFLQQIELAKIRTNEAIREAQMKAANVVNNLATFESGNLVYAPKSRFGPGAGALDTNPQEEGLQPPSGFTQVGDYITYPRPTSEQSKGMVNPFRVEAEEDGL